MSEELLSLKREIERLTEERNRLLAKESSLEEEKRQIIEECKELGIDPRSIEEERQRLLKEIEECSKKLQEFRDKYLT